MGYTLPHSASTTVIGTETKDLMLERDATISNSNVLTAWVMQLEAQLTQTLALVTAATNSSPASCKGQINPKKFTREDTGKLRSFVALLCLRLIDCPRVFPNQQLKLRYIFSRLEGAALEYMIHLVKDNYINLEYFEAFVMSLEEGYGDPDHVNTAKRALAKVCQGN
jgi:hypothetical protein